MTTLRTIQLRTKHISLLAARNLDAAIKMIQAQDDFPKLLKDQLIAHATAAPLHTNKRTERALPFSTEERIFCSQRSRPSSLRRAKMRS
jgi:hypothetical protein